MLIRAVARMRLVYLMLSNAAFLLSELNALLASTRRTAIINWKRILNYEREEYYYVMSDAASISLYIVVREITI